MNSLILVGAFTLFRLMMIGRTGLGDSESYYWTWSQHLDLSYYDHPPMTAWLIRLFTEIGGDSSFWTRMPSILLFLGICYFLYRIAERLFDAETGFWSLLIFNLMPIFSVAALQMVPDIPAAFCWTLFVYLVIRLLDEDRPLMWYPVGALVGLGLLSKYMIAPLVPATLLLLAWHGEYRKHLKQPHIYLGGVLGLIVFSPVIIWNYVNDFPSFRFHLVDRQQEAHFQLKQIAEFLGGQALYLSPLIWFGLLYVLYRCGAVLFADKDKMFAALFWYSAAPLAFFYFISMWSKESEPHWPAFGYITLIVAWAAFYVQAKGKLRKYTVASLMLSGALITVFYVHTFVPILLIKPKYDIVNELIGWDKVGAEVEKMYDEYPANKKPFLLAHHWVLCSQLSFSTQNRLPVYCLNQRTDQFDFFPNKVPPKGADFIFVADNRFKEPPEHFYNFDRADAPRELKIYRGKKHMRTFYIYKAYGFIGER